MSIEFRELLCKVGSGQHTSKSLTREEAAIALRMMLEGVATPAQIGAFLISHRIKRPTGEEMAGMLDIYDQFSEKIPVIPEFEKVVVLGIPYDGRDRTAPIGPITALILATANIPVIMHGGDRLPSKYGISLTEIWRNLGLDFTKLTVLQMRTLLQETHFCYGYSPNLLAITQTMIPYREQLGKRPPLATLELIWSPYGGKVHTIAGYVHPPTEAIIRQCLDLYSNVDYTLIKGLEGSGDLRLSQTTIAATNQTNDPSGLEYLKLDPYDYDLGMPDIPLESPESYQQQLQTLLNGDRSSLTPAVLWNGAFYLQHCGVVPDLSAGLSQVKTWLENGAIAQKFSQIQQQIH